MIQTAADQPSTRFGQLNIDEQSSSSSHASVCFRLAGMGTLNTGAIRHIRPRLLQAYDPVYDWGQGFELVHCNRVPAQAPLK